MKTTNNNRLPRWVNTALVALIGYALATVTLKAIPATGGISLDEFKARDAGAPVAPREDSVVTGNRIAALHLFGDVAEPPKPTATVKPPKATIKETPLNLKLAGVFAYEPQERAIAIISADNKPEEAYLVGDKIIGSVTLKSVHTDHVIINNNGRDEKVQLPDNGHQSLPAEQSLSALPIPIIPSLVQMNRWNCLQPLAHYVTHWLRTRPC